MAREKLEEVIVAAEVHADALGDAIDELATDNLRLYVNRLKDLMPKEVGRRQESLEVVSLSIVYLDAAVLGDECKHVGGKGVREALWPWRVLLEPAPDAHPVHHDAEVVSYPAKLVVRHAQLMGLAPLIEDLTNGDSVICRELPKNRDIQRLREPLGRHAC